MGGSSCSNHPVVGYTSVGNYTAPATPGTYSVVATSIADPSKTATMQVEVLPRMNVVMVSGTTYQGDVAQFAATVEGVADQAVTWSASGGTITQTGTFTAPNSAATIWITVVSVADPRASACYPVFIPDVSVSLNYGQTILGWNHRFTAGYRHRDCRHCGRLVDRERWGQRGRNRPSNWQSADCDVLCTIPSAEPPWCVQRAWPIPPSSRRRPTP